MDLRRHSVASLPIKKASLGTPNGIEEQAKQVEKLLLQAVSEVGSDVYPVQLESKLILPRPAPASPKLKKVWSFLYRKSSKWNIVMDALQYHHSFKSGFEFDSHLDSDAVPLLRGTAVEIQRLRDSLARKADWKRWGPYISERAWGTVREDYSHSGDAWNFITHDMSRSCTYRWNEDALAGWCDRAQNICMGLALWNHKDPILKERLFGLSGSQGNHGEDVKEYYFYLDSTPTHSYTKMLYKYPIDRFPYEQLEEENGRRSRFESEFELIDALPNMVGPDSNYFDVFIEYAKRDQQDILCRITAHNRNPKEAAVIDIIPHLWYRNTWSWGYERGEAPYEDGERPIIQKISNKSVFCDGELHLKQRWYYVEDCEGDAPDELLFTENDTNKERIWGVKNNTRHVKDAFHRYIIGKDKNAVSPNKVGSKFCAKFSREIAPGGSYSVYVRFVDHAVDGDPFEDFNQVFEQRTLEADEFYRECLNPDSSEEELNVQRQALAGMMFSKQFYHFGVAMWLDGDPSGPEPPFGRQFGRNSDWRHLYNADVISMPDKWEYPWYAAWDLAFHTLAIVLIDQEWAKRQLILMLREWYMHPNGQIPAYEWNFSDVNPPVHAWACYRVYRISYKQSGYKDVKFLERCFHKLLLNFTWWVNRKDKHGKNLFEGGFMGLDNIGVFDRSNVEEGFRLEQADSTAWMAMYCLDMLKISLELADHNSSYEDVATKFFEHFMSIMASISNDLEGLWDEDTGFFYDVLRGEDGSFHHLKIRSFVGLIPLFAVMTIDNGLFKKLPQFKARVEWFQKYRPEGATCLGSCPRGNRLLSLVSTSQLERILQRMLDEDQFLSQFGIRSLSKEHSGENVFTWVSPANGSTMHVSYEPAESSSPMYGGNSNWRGPIWFPTNFLMIEALLKFHYYYGDSFKVEYPTGSGNLMNLEDIAHRLSDRLINIFLPNDEGLRPVYGGNAAFSKDPYWKDCVLFYEYFHGEHGEGIGASHQTGWTGLVAKLIQLSRNTSNDNDSVDG